MRKQKPTKEQMETWLRRYKSAAQCSKSTGYTPGSLCRLAREYGLSWTYVGDQRRIYRDREVEA